MGSRTKIVRVRNRIFLQAFSYRWLSESGWCRPGGGAYRAAAACCGGPPGTPPGPPGPPAPGGGPAPGSDRTSGRADMPAAGPSGSARGRASSGSSPKILGFESGRLPVVTGCVWSSGPLSGRAKFRRVLPSGSLFFFAFRFLVSSFSVPGRAPPPPHDRLSPSLSLLLSREKLAPPPPPSRDTHSTALHAAIRPSSKQSEGDEQRALLPRRRETHRKTRK